MVHFTATSTVKHKVIQYIYTNLAIIKKTFLKTFSVACPRAHQIQDTGQSEYKTEIFSKITHKISKILSLDRDFMNV